MREASRETRPPREQKSRGASTAAKGVWSSSRTRTWRMDGVMRSEPGEPIASQGRCPRKTMVGATLAQLVTNAEDSDDHFSRYVYVLSGFGRLVGVAHVQLGQNIAHVALDRVDAYAQRVGDLFF